MPSPEHLLAAAQMAADAGHKDVARKYLNELLGVAPESEQGWILLAGVSPDLPTMKRALERAILINPRSPQALAGMEWVRRQEIRALRLRHKEGDEGVGDRGQGAGDREQGAGDREQGAGSREQGAGSREQGAVSAQPGPASIDESPVGRRLTPGYRQPATDNRQPATVARHQIEHSPTGRPGFGEVPLYPNAAFRRLLLAVEKVGGRERVDAILLAAGLDRYVGNYPPEDNEPQVPYSDYSAFGRALERHYGARARDIQLRIGEETAAGGGEASAARNVAQSAKKLVPGNLMVRRTLESLVRGAQDLGVPTDWEEVDGRFRYIVALCPYCFGRRTEVGCNALAGVLKVALKHATGRNYRVEEVTCRGRGDDTCSYEIAGIGRGNVNRGNKEIAR